MAPGSQARARARRERILDAALAIFTTRGYHDAAMDEIAAEAATSKGGLYFHFPNKQAIFLALIDRLGTQLLERAEAAITAETDPGRQLDAALTVVLHTFANHRSLTRLFLVDALGTGPEIRQALLQMHDRVIALIARSLNAAIAAGTLPAMDSWLIATAWFGALHEVVLRWALTGEPARLEDAYPTIRACLRRSVGLPVGPDETNDERQRNE
mgnify:CR=1 FL=1